MPSPTPDEHRQNLIDSYGLWGEHPNHNLDASSWRLAVENLTTRQGYWTWVVQELLGLPEPADHGDSTEYSEQLDDQKPDEVLSVPLSVINHARRLAICALNSGLLYPEDDWQALNGRWDLNLWLNGDQPRATIYAIGKGGTLTERWYTLELPDGK